MTAGSAALSPDRLSLSDEHSRSMRSAFIEDDGRAAWLYLTEPGSPRICGDCWLYNAVPAPAQRDFGRGETPVVPQTHTDHIAPRDPPAPDTVRFQWSGDGHSVAVFFGPELMGFIADAGPRGHSRLLSASGPYGSPMDESLYAAVFKGGR